MQTRSTNYLDDANYHRVAKFFNISGEDRRNSDLAGKISFLYDWGLSKSGGDATNALLAIKSLSNSLGLQMQGKELIGKLFAWSRLDTDRRRIEEQMGVISIDQKEEVKEVVEEPREELAEAVVEEPIKHDE